MIENGSKTAIVIAGYYRTGTSALSGALAESGVTFLNETDANEHNPKGFFEDAALIQIDIDILSTLGAYWSDIQFLPEGWYERQDMNALRNRLIEACRSKFNLAPLIGLKHPHVCRLFPIYQQALATLDYDIKVVMTHRDPYAVATSQNIKNGLTRSHALLLWAGHVLDAEANTRGFPRTWSFYDHLLEDQKRTVEDAMARLGLRIETPAHGFVTKSLRRSAPAPRDGVFPQLATLVAAIETAIHTDAPPSTWDGLRVELASLVDFLAEATSSKNRLLPGIGGLQTVQLQAGPAASIVEQSEAHALRPRERADAAARRRILEEIERLANPPSLAVLIVAPAGRDGEIARTQESIKRNWWQPVKVTVLRVGGTSSADGTLIAAESDEALAAAVTARVNQETGADYVGMLNAGDVIEPDAIARFVLSVGRAVSPPSLIYCDEIVNNPENPWIRTKPGWSLHRLREAYFIGDWVWYRTSTIQALGGLASDLPGAEEYDLQLRIAEAGLPVQRLPEALFVRNGGSRRDNLPLETAIGGAISALNAHLARSWPGAAARAGEFAGVFELEPGPARTPLTVGLICGSADIGTINAALNRILPTLGNEDRTVILRPTQPVDPGVDSYLDRIDAEIVPNTPNLRLLMDPGTAGRRVRALADLQQTAHVVLIEANAVPARDDVADLLRRYLDGADDIGVCGVRTTIAGPDRTSMLHGPLLYGASHRIGHGRDGGNPGPAGWLLSSHPVDAVDGPVIALRSPMHWLDGTSETWIDICNAARRSRLEVVWRPNPCVSLAAAPPQDDELDRARRRAWSARHHHPGLNVCGDPLLLEGRLGLIEESPGGRGVMITGPAKRHPVDSVRTWRRRTGGLGAWAPEPIDLYAGRRLVGGQRSWVRVDPTIRLEDAEGFTGIWTRPPALATRDVVVAASRCFGTSPAIVRALRGMGGRHAALWEPALDPELWQAFKANLARQRVVLWVNEGIAVPWLAELIHNTKDHCRWVVASDEEIVVPGDVARIAVPTFEDDWAAMLREMQVSTVVRPTPDTDWLDDHMLLIALAADCRIVAGRESRSERLAEAPITWINSDRYEKWEKRLLSDSGEMTDAGRRYLTEVSSAWASRDGFVEAWLRPGSADGTLAAA